MALMIPYSLDEFVAMGQFLLDAKRKGKPFWRTFWMGDAMDGGVEDTSKGLLGTRREKLAFFDIDRFARLRHRANEVGLAA